MTLSPLGWAAAAAWLAVLSVLVIADWTRRNEHEDRIADIEWRLGWTPQPNRPGPWRRWRQARAHAQTGQEPAQRPQEPPEPADRYTDTPQAEPIGTEPHSGSPDRETVDVDLTKQRPGPPPPPKTVAIPKAQPRTPDPDPPTQPALEKRRGSRAGGRWGEDSHGNWTYRTDPEEKR